MQQLLPIIFLFFTLGIAQVPKGIDFTNKVIHICALFTDPNQEALEDPSYDGFYRDQGMNQARALDFFSSISKGVTVQNVSYKFNITYINLGTTDAKVINRTKEALNGTYGDCFLFFGPFSSGWTALVAPLIEADVDQRIMLAPLAHASEIFQCGSTMAEVVARPPCTKVNTRRYQRVWALGPPTETNWHEIMLNLKLLGAKSISIWAPDDIFTQAMTQGLLDISASAGIRVDSVLTSNVTLTTQEMAEIVTQLGGTKSDIIAVIPRLDQQCASFVLELKRQNVNAKAFFLSQCIAKPHVIDEAGVDLRYFFDYATWDSRLRGSVFIDDFYFPPNSTNTSSQLFAYAYEQEIGFPPDATAAGPTFNQGVLLEQVLTRSQDFNLTVINAAFGSTSMRTFLGRINFNEYGVNDIKPVLHIQRGVDLQIEIADPISSATIPLIFPFPRWAERNFFASYLGYPEEQAIFGLYGFCVISTAVLGILIFVFRGHATFKAAAPNILFVMVIGTMFLLTGAVTWMMYMDTPMCYLRVWFLALGMTLVFGALVAKTQRIYHLFLKTQLQVVAYTDTDIFIHIGIMVLYDLIVLIIWCAVERPVAELMVIDPLRPVYNYWTCKWTTMSWVMIGVIGLKQLAVACYGIFLSIQLWKFGSTMFGESKETIFSLYNFTLLVGLIVAIEASLQEERQTLFIVRSLIILLGAMSIISALILPKFKGMDGSDIERVQKKITSGSNSKKSGSKSRKSSGGGSFHSSIGDATPTERLLKENEKLKNENIQLKNELDTFKRSVQ